FAWYNGEHRHSGIGLLTPAIVHAGRAPEVRAARATTLEAAYTAHPELRVRVNAVMTARHPVRHPPGDHTESPLRRA
ncbi:MAG: hypothetical protein HYX54_03885, partial [Chloroflexi bacterium]|nr:hypothetical protein [Chloroflexota bacterium]